MVFLIVVIGNYLVVRSFFPDADVPVTVPYTVFKEQAAKGNVKSIYSRGTSIEGKFAVPVTWPAKEGRSSATFTTELPAFVDPGLEKFLIDREVEISAVPIRQGSSWATLLLGFGPAILIIAFYVWMYRRAQQGGGMQRIA